MKVEGLVAIVTGGASGLGEAAALELSARGAKVVIADINKDLGDKVVEKIGSSQAIFIETNVTQEDAVKNLIEKTICKFGSIHIVVNCAGVLVMSLIYSSKCTGDELMKVFKINVLGTLLVTKHASAHMMKQEPVGEFKERGVIINIASVAGIEGHQGLTIYSATKGAIIGMTLPLARDLGKFGIRVVTVAPGLFPTPISKGVNVAVGEIMKKSIPLGRLGYPKEFGNCVASLCMNSYITGEVIRVDGGIRLPHL